MFNFYRVSVCANNLFGYLWAKVSSERLRVKGGKNKGSQMHSHLKSFKCLVTSGRKGFHEDREKKKKGEGAWMSIRERETDRKRGRYPARNMQDKCTLFYFILSDSCKLNFKWHNRLPTDTSECNCFPNFCQMFSQQFQKHQSKKLHHAWSEKSFNTAKYEAELF